MHSRLQTSPLTLVTLLSAAFFPTSAQAQVDDATGDVVIVSVTARETDLPLMDVELRPRWLEAQPFLTAADGTVRLPIPREDQIDLFGLELRKTGLVAAKVRRERDQGLSDLPIPRRIEVVMESSGTIGGIVRDLQGNPVAGVEVRGFSNIQFNLERWGEGYQVGSQGHGFTRTNAEGRWRISGLHARPASLRLIFAHPDFLEARVELTADHDEEAIAGYCESTGEDILRMGMSIAGRVVDESGRPIVGAMIDTARERLTGEVPILTDEQGRFGVTKLTPGTVVLVARAPGFLPGLVRPFIGVDAGPVEIRLERGGTLRGLIADRDGKPIAGADVHVFAAKAIDRDLGHVRSGADGRFRLDGSPPDGLTLTVTRAGYSKVIVEDVGTAGVSRIQLEPGGPARPDFGELLDAPAPPGAPGITGIVRMPDGQPAAGAELVIAPPEGRVDLRDGQFQYGQPFPFARTDTEGRFSLPNRFAWPDQLVVVHESGTAISLAAEPDGPREVTLTPWGRIEGAYLRVGQPVARGHLHVYGMVDWPINVYQSSNVDADDQGQFVIERLIPGTVSIASSLREDDRSVATINVPIDAGVTTSRTIGESGRAIVGRIRVPESLGARWPLLDRYLSLSTGKPLPRPIEELSHEEYERIKREQADSTFRFATSIEEDGSFRIEHVAPGSYKLLVRIEERIEEPHRSYPVRYAELTQQVDVAGSNDEESKDDPINLGAFDLDLVDPDYSGD